MAPAPAPSDQKSSAAVPGRTSIFDQPAVAARIGWIRIVTYGSILYYLLSRDFGTFGIMAPELLEFYPQRQYALETGYAMFSVSYAVDLASFHFIHWFLPLPSTSVLETIQWICIGCCAGVVFLGRGPYAVLSWAACVTFLYLEGYLWRSGADQHCLPLNTMVMLLLCFFRESDALTIVGGRRSSVASPRYGAVFSIVLLTFCAYYSAAGFNKLVDITPLDWFRFDLFQSIGLFHDMIEFGAPYSVLPGLDAFREWGWLSRLGAPLAYSMELSIPVIFFRRRWISTYLGFFVAFHVILCGIPCVFLGLILIWLALIPVERIASPVTVRFDAAQRSVAWLVNRVRSSPRCAETQCTAIPSEAAGAAREQECVELCDQSGEVFRGIYAVRRLLWVAPVFWPVMFILYVPFVSQLLEWCVWPRLIEASVRVPSR